MKYNKVVRDLYDDYQKIASLQKKYLDAFFKEKLQDYYYLYESRIKSIESFALKLETGRDAFEDFFACRFIVLKKEDIEKIKNELTNNNIKIERSRPKDINETTKNPDIFSFDELRLYVKYNQPSNMELKEYLDNIFEIQIMTMYSLVWAQTTHDLIYKSNDISWGKARVAYQIKALLEQAQYAIDTIDKTEDAYFPKNKVYEAQNQMLQYITSKWKKELLPKDLNRLSNNILNLIKALNSNFEEMKELVNKQNAADNGYIPINITPYQYILKSYFKQKPKSLLDLLSKKNKHNFHIVLVEDLDIEKDIITKLVNKGLLTDYRKSEKK